MIANGVFYVFFIGLWIKERKANYIGMVLLCVLEFLTLIFGIYVAASNDSFKTEWPIAKDMIDAIAYECIFRVVFFILIGACRYY